MKDFIWKWIISVCACIIHHPLRTLLFVPRFFREYFAYRRISKQEKVNFCDTYPCLIDKTVSTPFDAHYFYQGAWLARKLSNINPLFHVDVGSSVMMISVLSASVKTFFVDYRPLQVDLPEITSIGANITNLPFDDESLLSLSSQHVIEHIGLGRYGDPVDPKGTKKSASELERVLKVGGYLYLSLPVGRERVCFNAHRVLSPKTVLSYFPSMKLIEFSCVDDSEKLFLNADISSVDHDNYACGMFVLEKI